ncbi:unnamed protein product, partial [Porites lobata]
MTSSKRSVTLFFAAMFVIGGALSQSPPMGVLNCSMCAVQTEAACTALQTTRECLMDQLCLTLETITTTNQTSFTRDCFPSMACSFPSVICDIINQTSNGTTL